MNTIPQHGGIGEVYMNTGLTSELFLKTIPYPFFFCLNLDAFDFLILLESILNTAVFFIIKVHLLFLRLREN